MMRGAINRGHLKIPMNVIYESCGLKSVKMVNPPSRSQAPRPHRRAGSSPRPWPWPQPQGQNYSWPYSPCLIHSNGSVLEWNNVLRCNTIRLNMSSAKITMIYVFKPRLFQRHLLRKVNTNQCNKEIVRWRWCRCARAVPQGSGERKPCWQKPCWLIYNVPPANFYSVDSAHNSSGGLDIELGKAEAENGVSRDSTKVTLYALVFEMR